MPRVPSRVRLPSARQESKRERFERLAQRRVTQVLRRLQLIGNLANRGNYDYTDDHVRQIFETLETEVRYLRKRFHQREGPSGRTFSFRK